MRPYRFWLTHRPRPRVIDPAYPYGNHGPILSRVFSISRASTSGSTNPALYATSTGSPDTRGWAVELDYLPWQNVKLAIQYVAYTKFDGSSSNYDGTGRNASDNNTLYIFAWFAF